MKMLKGEALVAYCNSAGYILRENYASWLKSRVIINVDGWAIIQVGSLVWPSVPTFTLSLSGTSMKEFHPVQVPFRVQAFDYPIFRSLHVKPKVIMTQDVLNLLTGAFGLNWQDQVNADLLGFDPDQHEL